MILVCAATRTEADACRRGIADAGVGGFEVVTTGVGPARAAAALARRLRGAAPSARPAPPVGERDERTSPPSLVVSSGFAGALTAGVEPLQWVTASSLHRLEGGRAVAVELPPGLLRAAEGALPCALLTAGHAAARGAAGLAPPAVVDMESAALAEAAARAGVPFSALRLVTDTPARPLADLGRALAATLAAPDPARGLARGATAALVVARSPIGAASFVREALGWRAALRRGWREWAARGF